VLVSDVDPTQEPLPSTPLRLAALEVEAHVAADGWDQAPRLYALVRTAALVEAEPALAAQLAVPLQNAPDGFTTIEQELDLGGRALEDVLDDIEWPDAVDGCAVVVERLMLPPEAEADLPDDPAAWAAAAAAHPDRQDVRLVAVVDRAGGRHSAVRARRPDDAPLLEGPDLVPALVQALHRTLDATS
jgi:hypothetical protein